MHTSFTRTAEGASEKFLNGYISLHKTSVGSLRQYGRAGGTLCAGRQAGRQVRSFGRQTKPLQKAARPFYDGVARLGDVTPPSVRGGGESSCWGEGGAVRSSCDSNSLSSPHFLASVRTKQDVSNFGRERCGAEMPTSPEIDVFRKRQCGRMFTKSPGPAPSFPHSVRACACVRLAVRFPHSHSSSVTCRHFGQ